jgi:hypothetical protein
VSGALDAPLAGVGIADRDSAGEMEERVEQSISQATAWCASAWRREYEKEREEPVAGPVCDSQCSAFSLSIPRFARITASKLTGEAAAGSLTLGLKSTTPSLYRHRACVNALLTHTHTHKHS